MPYCEYPRSILTSSLDPRGLVEMQTYDPLETGHIIGRPGEPDSTWERCKDIFEAWMRILKIPKCSINTVRQATLGLNNQILMSGYNIESAVLKSYWNILQDNFPKNIPREWDGALSHQDVTDKRLAESPEGGVQHLAMTQGKPLTIKPLIRAALQWRNRRTKFENVAKTLEIVWACRNECGRYSRDWFDRLVITLDKLLDVRNFTLGPVRGYNTYLLGDPEAWVQAMSKRHQDVTSKSGILTIVQESTETPSTEYFKNQAYTIINQIHRQQEEQALLEEPNQMHNILDDMDLDSSVLPTEDNGYATRSTISAASTNDQSTAESGSANSMETASTVSTVSTTNESVTLNSTENPANEASTMSDALAPQSSADSMDETGTDTSFIIIVEQILAEQNN